MTPDPTDDLVVLDADVRTMEPGFPRARAFAVRGGRVAHVGAAAGARAAVSPRARVLEAGGRVITPGLTDAHTHLLSWVRARSRLSLAGVPSLEDALAAVAGAHARLAPGARLEGEDVPPFGAWGALPDRLDLDRVAPGRSVVLHARDRHAAWVSSAALEEAGITRATPDPAGGRIARDPAGEPTGLIYERALEQLARPGDAPDLDGLAAAIARLHELGITAVHDFGTRDAWGALLALRARGRLDLRVAFGFVADGPEGLAAVPEPGELAADELLWPFALKLFVDGTLGSRTAWMLDPYADGSGSGMARNDAEGLDAAGEAARVRGWSLAMHAIGDRATRAALDAFARWPADARARLRPRIEHAQLVHPDDLPRFAGLGVVASMQPVHAVSDRALAERLWGARDAVGGYAWSALERAGAQLVFGSDVPIEDPDPRAGLAAAVTGGDASAWAKGHAPPRALTLDRAFAAFTSDAAYAGRGPEGLGRLAAGAPADFVVWDQDPWTTPADRLAALPIDSTWVGGRRVWPPV